VVVVEGAAGVFGVDCAVAVKVSALIKPALSTIPRLKIILRKSPGARLPGDIKELDRIDIKQLGSSGPRS